MYSRPITRLATSDTAITAVLHPRDAVNSIKGYIYQFDATILMILNSADDDLIVIEGVEDFDHLNSATNAHYQCKHYASQRLTRAVIRDALIPMLVSYLALHPQDRSKQNYVLYGYFRDSPPEQQTFDAETLAGLLVKRQVLRSEDGSSTEKLIDLVAELGATFNDLIAFSERFIVKKGVPYDEHKNLVLKSLQTFLAVSETEAKLHLYPTALTVVSEIATLPTESERQITRAVFLSRLKSSTVLYNAWMLREVGEQIYCRKMRETYFTSLNIEPADRFFIIDTPHNASDDALISVTLALIAKWSTHRSPRKPDNERYAPYLLFMDLQPERLISIKTSLARASYIFRDGYSFRGADFDPLHLNAPQTKHFPIAARFINHIPELQATINSATRAKHVFFFYREANIEIQNYHRFVRIPISSIPMIESII